MDDFDLWAMRLSRLGYGDIVTIKNLDSETFINLIHYENFNTEYDNTVRMLNNGK